MHETLLQYERDFDGLIGVAFKDLTNGSEIAVNGDIVFPIASMVKIPILLEFFKQAMARKLSPDKRVWIEKEHKVADSGVLQYLGDHTVNCTLRDLAVLMINVSDNTAANLLIDFVGMDNVNSTLRTLGLEATRLARKMMDVKAAIGGNENVSTPSEITSLLRKLQTHEGIDEGVARECLNILKMPKLERYLSSGLPPGTVVANKPGELPGVLLDGGVIYLPDHPYVLSVMTTFTCNRLSAQAVIHRVSKIVYEHVWRVAQSSEFGRRFDETTL
jgi:beta-lactamase class A